MTIPLRTERLWLVPLDPQADAADVHDAFTDAEVMRFWVVPPSADLAATTSWLIDALTLEGAHLWALRESEHGPVIGFVGILGSVPVPGLQWLLRRQWWGNGYAAEAVIAVVEHALGELALDRVEAWVDPANIRSLAVARRAGLTERGRLIQRYPHRDHPQQSIVLGRSRQPEQDSVINVVVELLVRDVPGTIRLLQEALDFHIAFTEGEPLTFAALSIGPWNGGRRIHLIESKKDTVSPVALTLEVVADAFHMYQAAVDAGAKVNGPPEVEPWGRREFVIQLPEGHALTVSCPV